MSAAWLLQAKSRAGTLCPATCLVTDDVTASKLLTGWKCLAGDAQEGWEMGGLVGTWGVVPQSWLSSGCAMCRHLPHSRVTSLPTP